jgi:hypothetical protein
MVDDNKVDADIKQGLRILADSTKLKGTEGVARRLAKAADTGMIEDYQQAEIIFDSLPTNKRATIKISAETKAQTIRLTNDKRQQAASNKTAIDVPASAPDAWELGDPNSTEGIFNSNGALVGVETSIQEKPLDTQNELDALKEEMQQALKG